MKPVEDDLVPWLARGTRLDDECTAADVIILFLSVPSRSIQTAGETHGSKAARHLDIMRKDFLNRI